MILTLHKESRGRKAQRNKQLNQQKGKEKIYKLLGSDKKKRTVLLYIRG